MEERSLPLPPPLLCRTCVFGRVRLIGCALLEVWTFRLLRSLPTRKTLKDL